jgi:hypothetical protein
VTRSGKRRAGEPDEKAAPRPGTRVGYHISLFGRFGYLQEDAEEGHWTAPEGEPTLWFQL